MIVWYAAPSVPVLRSMDFLLPYSWLLLPAAAGAACILVAELAWAATALHRLATHRRHFRQLVEFNERDPGESSAYQDGIRPHAFALGFEFVRPYRAYSQSKRRLRAELWRAQDRETLAVLSSERIGWRRCHRTDFISVLENGERITTSDNFDEGDPLALKGELIRRELDFRDLYRLHRRRLGQSGHAAETLGQSDPLSVVVDLERARVQQLAAAGLSRYRDDAQISWSYTLRGACDVYYRARPRQVREHLAYRAAQAKTAE